jgi:hypothetical protein
MAWDVACAEWRSVNSAAKWMAWGRVRMGQSIEGLLARIRHPVLKRMVTFWDAKRGARDWPLRTDFDPLEFWFAVGYVSLIDVHEDAGSGRRRYYFRLDGTRQVDLFGVDFTGKFLDQIADPDALKIAEQSYGAAVEQGRPQYHERQVEFHDRPIRYEAVILPLSRTGARLDMLMTAVTPDEEI